MKSVCKQFGVGQVGSLPAATQGLIIGALEPELAFIAKTFVAMQEERHSADYDTSKSFNRLDVLSKIDQVTQAFSDWSKVRNKPNAVGFLAALLLQKQWSK